MTENKDLKHRLLIAFAVLGIIAVVGVCAFAVTIKVMSGEQEVACELHQVLASEEAILELLREYDPDGDFLVETGIAKGDDISQYYDEIFNYAGAVLDRVVHEEFHSFAETGKDKEVRIYLGKDDYVIVPFTETFYTKELADTIPENCRTVRYPEYISNAEDELSANCDGAYGLLNEFCAYYWGMNNNMCMYPCYQTKGDSLSGWTEWITLADSNKLAYAEFKYYILHYLYYARENHPEVYQGIMANEDFKRAYNETEQRFAEDIDEYYENVREIKKHLSNFKTVIKYKQDEEIKYKKLWEEEYTTIQLLGDMYNPIMEELQKPQYKEIEEELKK